MCGNNDKERADIFKNLLVAMLNDDYETAEKALEDIIDREYISEKDINQAKTADCDLRATCEFIDAMKSADNTEDLINHPDHYTDGPIECFDLIRAMEGEERAAGFAIGNVWKYLYRHNKKGHDLEDIRKAIKYANFYLEIMENV